jgi:hypothetical protein
MRAKDIGLRISDCGLWIANCDLRSAIAFLLVLVAGFDIASVASAQVAEEKPEVAPDRVRYGEPNTIRFRVGAEITASQGNCRNIVAMVAVPLECPEQSVRTVDEDITSDVGSVDYRMLQGGARQMLISIPRLANGAKAHAIVTFEVSTRPIIPPEKTDDLKIPEHPPSALHQFLAGSPFIEVQHHAIKSLGKEIMSGIDSTATDWQKVEAIYDYVLSHVEYVEGPDKSAIEALNDKQADCQGRSMLFIALCRANKIPARMVWLDGHVYPEFYLENDKGEGAWYPCESAGTRAFGEMPLARTILQKGDNFRVPERPKDRLRYASDYLIGKPESGGGPPSYRFIREQMAK